MIQVEVIFHDLQIKFPICQFHWKHVGFECNGDDPENELFQQIFLFFGENMFLLDGCTNLMPGIMPGIKKPFK